MAALCTGIRPEYDFRIIGKNLSRLRKDRKLSVEQVRAYMQLGSVQAVYKWERGDSLPQADSLLALLQLYGVTNIEKLFEESESSPLSFSFNHSASYSIFLLYNFLFEFGAAIILSPALVTIIKVVTKKFDDKKELKEIENANE